MVYSDVVKNGLILEKKKKYTISDFRKLVEAGFTQLQARFIVICSDIYYYYDEQETHASKFFYTENFTLKCKYNRAL